MGFYEVVPVGFVMVYKGSRAVERCRKGFIRHRTSETQVVSWGSAFSVRSTIAVFRVFREVWCVRDCCERLNESLWTFANVLSRPNAPGGV